MFSWKRALPQETTASTDTPANSLKPSSVNGTSAARVLLIRKDRKSTRLNSSHSQISYAVFCLKKKKKTELEYSCRALHNPSTHSTLLPSLSAASADLATATSLAQVILRSHFDPAPGPSIHVI